MWPECNLIRFLAINKWEIQNSVFELQNCFIAIFTQQMASRKRKSTGKVLSIFFLSAMKICWFLDIFCNQKSFAFIFSQSCLPIRNSLHDTNVFTLVPLTVLSLAPSVEKINEPLPALQCRQWDFILWMNTFQSFLNQKNTIIFGITTCRRFPSLTLMSSPLSHSHR